MDGDIGLGFLLVEAKAKLFLPIARNSSMTTPNKLVFKFGRWPWIMILLRWVD
ncbi:MAG: hypothetical protein IPP40_15360 [bacterium]|nr:hypothetical protein [bacterium]